jgi:hypothetical protein
MREEGAAQMLDRQKFGKRIDHQEGIRKKKQGA